MPRSLGERLPPLSDLELLQAVAHQGSMTAAAREFGLSQQAVSLRIRALERQTGITVLTRSHAGCALTPAGQLVTEWASKLLREADQMAAALAALQTGQSAHLRVASSLTIAEHLLPGWLVTLHEQQSRAGQPPTQVELTAVNTTAVLDRVRRGDAEIGFIEGPQPAVGLRVRNIGRDQLAIVVAPTHPWTRRRTPVPVSLLATTPLVRREAGSGARQALDDAFAAALPRGLRLADPALVVTTPAASRAAVMAGVGPAAVPTSAIADDLSLGRLAAVPVAGIDLHRTLRAVWNGDSRPPPGPGRDLLAIAAHARHTT